MVVVVANDDMVTIVLPRGEVSFLIAGLEALANAAEVLNGFRNPHRPVTPSEIGEAADELAKRLSVVGPRALEDGATA